MKRKNLRWISITLSALLLIGSVLSIAADNNSVIYAAKKRTTKEKKANKLPKKKITKKPVKKITKKPVKKVVKKPVKKTTKKKVIKKSVKKTTKNKAVKKPVKKATKNKVAKKPVKKTNKKKVVKKPVKNTTKNPIKKTITMAEKYPPLVTKDAINIPWGMIISWNDDQGAYDLANCITNRVKLNSYISKCELEYKNSVDVTHGGTYQARIVVDYRDGSTYITDPVTFNVSTADADKYEPTYKTDIYLSHDDVNHILYSNDNVERFVRNNILTNADGYFPNEDAQFNRTKFNIVEKITPGIGYLWDSYHWLQYSNAELDSTTGVHEYCIKIMYPDHSYYITKPIKIHVKPYQSEEYLPILKNELVLKKDQQADENVLKSLFSNANSLPKETSFLLTDGWLDTSVIGKQKIAIKVEYPDGSSYVTPQVAVYVK